MENSFDFSSPPVLMIMFNRPHKAAEVFAKVRQVRPKKLFIAVDGARPNRPGEAEKVQQCRAFKDLVDWDCDLKLNFAETNMGCKNRISSGITWAFEHVEELIILEDDCVPDLTFFRFCGELLEKYRDDNRIFSIGGFNADCLEPFDESYAFSKIFTEWGWATWRRAWKHFDVTMKQWPLLKQDRYLQNIFARNDPSDLDANWKGNFQIAYDGGYDTWALRFSVNCLANHGLHIVPQVNLVRNIGFESNGGRHQQFPYICNLYMDEPITFPLTHPEIMSPLNRISGPPIIPEIPKNQNEITRILTDCDAVFKQLLKFKKYHAIIICFKENVLRNRIFSMAHGLTPYHLNWAYYVALAYFQLQDYEHAAAMIDILLTFNPQNVDLNLFLIDILLKQKNFAQVCRVVETMLASDVNNFTTEQKNSLAQIVENLNSAVMND